MVSCSLCGKLILDTPEENQDFEVRACDDGFGMCKNCGGDPAATKFWKKHGWAARSFYEARFEIVADKLSPEHAATFNSWKVERKVAYIARLIEKGIMI